MLSDVSQGLRHFSPCPDIWINLCWHVTVHCLRPTIINCTLVVTLHYNNISLKSQGNIKHVCTHTSTHTCLRGSWGDIQCCQPVTGFWPNYYCYCCVLSFLLTYSICVGTQLLHSTISGVSLLPFVLHLCCFFLNFLHIQLFSCSWCVSL